MMQASSTLSAETALGQAVDSVSAEIIQGVELHLRRIAQHRWAESRPPWQGSITGPSRSRIQVWQAGDPRRRFEERGR
jgi:hypothetical protein